MPMTPPMKHPMSVNDAPWAENPPSKREVLADGRILYSEEKSCRRVSNSRTLVFHYEYVIP